MPRRWLKQCGYLLATVLLAVPLLSYTDHEGDLWRCVHNLNRIGLANLNYSTDSGGAWAPDLDTLARSGYLESMPECPSGGVYVYSLAEDDGYTVRCEGSAHHGARVPPGHPHLDSAFQSLGCEGVCPGTGQREFNGEWYPMDRACRNE